MGLAFLLAWGVEQGTLKQKRVPGWLWIPPACIWLAFLPNTCYLVTEWRHFLFDNHYTMLRDAAETNRVLMLSVAKQGLFFLFYSGIGVLCYALSIRPLDRLLQKAGFRSWPWAVPFFFLTSLGVYLGLIVRLNSWDIATRPLYVLQVAVQAVLNPLLLKTIIGFAFLLWLLYLLVDIWIDGLLLRGERCLSGLKYANRK